MKSYYIVRLSRKMNEINAALWDGNDEYIPISAKQYWQLKNDPRTIINDETTKGEIIKSNSSNLIKT